MNQELIKLYTEQLDKLRSADIPFNHIDGTLLMHCWEDQYLASKYKMLFVGQECNGWMGDLVLETAPCIEAYKEFALCESGKYSTFWQYIYETKNILMPNTVGQKNFLWTNVSKFSTLEGGPIDWDTFHFFSDHFQVLQKEIEIVKPDVIIFFSGSSYDPAIRYQISHEIVMEEVDEAVSVEQLARLTSEAFPYHTYRLGHPGYLNRNAGWKLVETIINSITSA